MKNELELYKSFIDGLVGLKDGVLSKWILEKGYPHTDENKDINELLSTLSDDQKAVLVKMVTNARISGIHDALAYMNEKMDLEGLVISQDGLPCDLTSLMAAIVFTEYSYEEYMDNFIGNIQLLSIALVLSENTKMWSEEKI